MLIRALESFRGPQWIFKTIGFQDLFRMLGVPIFSSGLVCRQTAQGKSIHLEPECFFENLLWSGRWPSLSWDSFWFCLKTQQAILTLLDWFSKFSNYATREICEIHDAPILLSGLDCRPVSSLEKIKKFMSESRFRFQNLFRNRRFSSTSQGSSWC